MQPYLQYIVLLGAVVIVGAFVLPRKKQDTALPPQAMQNMETALEQFMENMEKDNEELVLLVRNAQLESKTDASRKDQRIAQLEKKCEQLTEQLQLIHSVGGPTGRQAETPAPALPVDTFKQQQHEFEQPELDKEATPEPKTIQSRYKEIFVLYEQGKSIEIISKKLGMNKGEVQLIIQLAKQEGAAHA